MRKSLLLALALAALALAEEPPPGIERKIDPTKDVAILVNDNVPDSVAIGDYYAKKRGIPAEQICHVKTVPDEIISWPAFRKDVLEPVKKFLETRTTVLYLVPVFGVPVKTSEENPENDGKAGMDTISLYVTGRDYACIDRELELLYQPHEIEGWLQSKLFGAERHPTLQDKLLVVSRLDGPTPESVRALVDNALYGEAYGVGGKALVDVRGLSSPGDGYTECDKRMKECAQVFEKAGVPFELDEKPDVVDLASCPALGHYWGWYTGTIVCTREGGSCAEPSAPTSTRSPPATSARRTTRGRGPSSTTGSRAPSARSTSRSSRASPTGLCSSTASSRVTPSARPSSSRTR